MRYQLRWLLPLAQLLVCVVALWPARGLLLFGVMQARGFHAPAREETGQESVSQRVILLPEFDQERQVQVDDAYEKMMRHLRIPVVLNFPVVVAQVPYLLITRREWVPQGMLVETWRALIWPLLGIAFWWLAGRGIESLFASFQSTIRPRLRWMEVIWAFILSVIGIAAFMAILMSTPADRRDKDYIALIYGALLWGVLAGLTLTARFRHWQISKGNAGGGLVPEKVNE